MDITCKLLLVDDHQLFLDGLSSILEQSNHDMSLVCCERSVDALEKLKQGLDIDLVLLDLHMPELDGLSFLKALQGLEYVPAVLIVSSDADVRVIHQSLSLGAAGFVPKSVDSATMLTAIEETLLTGTFLPQPLKESLMTFEAGLAQIREKLSEKQSQVLEYLAQDLSNAQIAEKLFVSRHAVKYHLSQLFDLMEVSNRRECLEKAQQLGLLGQNLPS